MGKDKRDRLILILAIVTAVLLIVLAFIFLVNPALNGLVIQGQNQGYNYAVQQLFSLAAQCQNPVPVTMGNQTINLIAVECMQQPSS